MTEELERLAQLLQPAKTVLIIVGESANFEQLATALALTQTIQSAGKEVQVCCPVLPTQLQIVPEHLALISRLELVSNSLGKQNLIISFDYVESAVDKVSYAISQDNKKFFLTIKPQAGAKPLNAESIGFEYAGTSADLIFLLGVHDLSSLRQLYFGYEEMYVNTPIITINNSKPDFSHIHFNVADVSCYAEMATMMLGGLQLDIAGESATLLYAGMALATKSFSAAKVQANSFEIAAELLRRGARRPKELQLIQSNNQTPNNSGKKDYKNNSRQK